MVDCATYINENNCPFCNIAEDEEILFETDNFIFMKDKDPVCEGHSLLVYKHHVRVEPLIEHKFEFFEASQRAWEYMTKHYSYPITFVHAPKLQSIPHYHRHYVPSHLIKVEAIKKGLRNSLEK